MEFDMAQPLIRHGIFGREADGQCVGVEPRGAARPGGVPAELGLTPHNSLPAGSLFYLPALRGACHSKAGNRLTALVNELLRGLLPAA